MKFLKQKYQLHTTKMRHTLVDGHAVLGLITHDLNMPTEYKAIVKHGSETKEIEFFDDLEDAKRWLISMYVNRPVPIQKEDFNPDEPIFIYHNRKFIARCKNIKQARIVSGYNQNYILNHWAEDYSQLSRYNYSFSNKKIEKDEQPTS